jgi:hypothetical protein
MRFLPVKRDLATLVPLVMVFAGTLLLGAYLGLNQRSEEKAGGIPPCPAGADKDLLSPAAIQCWFMAPHGSWRVLSRVHVHAVLIVEAQAVDPRDAEAIARSFVDAFGKTFLEIVVYVQRESGPRPGLIRRVSWTRRAGFDALEFTGRLDR